MSEWPPAAAGIPLDQAGLTQAGLTQAGLNQVAGDEVMPDLAALERWATAQGLLLRLRLGRRLGIRALQVGVARPLGPGQAQLLGELKGWALPSAAGLQLDTMRVQGQGTALVGPLIWAATFAWALEATPCRSARLLAIHDDDRQHRRLVRYFSRLGFEPVRELGAGPADLPLRLIWGGAGLLMRGDCAEGLRRCQRRLARADQGRAA